MMDAACLELNVRRLGSSPTKQNQRLPVCKQFVGTSAVPFQSAQIYIFLLYCICTGVRSYRSDSEAVITFPQ